jgi:hypothetical protein
MSADVSLVSHTASQPAESLRTVFDLLAQGLALEQMDPSALEWHKPTLVLRSAHMGRMRAFLHQVHLRTETPMLHVMSHARDEAAIREMAPFPIVFHAYPVPGRYRPEDMPADLLATLRQQEFETAFFLDAGTAGDLLEDVERLLAEVRKDRMVSFRGDGTFARNPDWPLRRASASAFDRLLDWYHIALESGARV